MHFNYLEMKYLVFCVTLNLLFFANIVSSAVTIEAKYDDKEKQTKKYEIRQALQLSCNVTNDAADERREIEVKWLKEDELVTENQALKKRLSLSHNGNIYKLQLNSAGEKDGGRYKCVAYYMDGSVAAEAYIKVESRIYVKIPRDISVVEGEKLKVTCLVHGNPTPQILWIYKNVTYGADKNRVKLEDANNVPNSVFTLEDVREDDQDELTCKGNTTDTSDPSVGVIRVKDKYAALWPFIGICAEVLVLCAIIFIYEKKRNKTELEESDTDQSPEQKNTPDHGGKETNLRHRQ